MPLALRGVSSALRPMICVESAQANALTMSSTI